MASKGISTIKINIEKYKDILWLFVVVYMSKLFLSAEQQFLFFLFFLLFVIAFNRKIIIPKINGFWGYLAIIILATVVGLVSFETRSVYRDLFYYIPTLLMIVIGYYLYVMHKGKYDIFKTLMVCALLNVFIALVQLFINYRVSGDIEIFKENISYGLYDNLYILIALLVFKIYDSRVLFNRIIDTITIVAIFVQIGASLYRGILLSFIVSFFIVMILTNFITQKGRTVRNIIVYIGLFIVLIIVVFRYVPEDALFSFDEKVDKTTEEINADQEINSVSEAMSHWRAYEKQSATTQWKNSPFTKQMIGGGMGQNVHIKYVPYNWPSEVVEGGGIAVLHSAYHTTLAKCGAIGVLLLILLFLQQIILGFRKIKKQPALSIILIAIVVSIVIQSYVTNGLVGRGANIFWAVIVGWINAEFNRGKEIEDSEE